MVIIKYSYFKPANISLIINWLACRYMSCIELSTENNISDNKAVKPKNAPPPPKKKKAEKNHGFFYPDKIWGGYDRKIITN